MLHLNVFIPLFLFMLFPVWIPVIGTLSGKVADRLRPVRRSDAELVVAEAKAASERGRAIVRETRVESEVVDLPMAA